ncbi:MAG: SMC-Scp complex subunit ScpB [Candidatus Bathyarchaeia archaeon]
MKGRPDSKDPVALIEAALYVSGRPLEISALSKLVGRPEGEVRGLIEKLAERYDSSGSPIQILRLSNDRYVMQLRPEYVEYVKRFSNKRLLTLGPLRSLSLIAIRQPITQAYLVKVRGKLAYQHVKKLKEMELVEEERMGRTKILRTTRMFSDMFNLSYDLPTMKRQLKALLGDKAAQGGQGVKEKS